MWDSQKFRELVNSVINKSSRTEHDGALHTLVEVGPSALPYVIEALEAARDMETKLTLLSVISEYRTSESLGVLANELNSPEGEIWKLALDGLVTLGGESALQVLAEAVPISESGKRAWITEAMEQIEAAMHGSRCADEQDTH